jgi:predicted nucleotidyltransferase
MPGAEEHNVDRPLQGSTTGGEMALAVHEAVARIVEQAHPSRIILFGSAARDESSPQSDIDLLVVMPEGTHKRRTAQMLYRKLRGLPVPVDIVVTTEIDLNQQKDNPGLIYRTILQEGKVLYAA